MNERLEAFRKRLRELNRSKVKWHQQIGSPTAWLALIFSTTTFFNTFFYHSDELSVSFLRPSVSVGKVYFTDDGGSVEEDIGLRRPRIYVVAPQGVTFINSGSRPVVVRGVWVKLAQPLKTGEKASCTDNQNSTQTDGHYYVFEPTVIKPYDLQYKPLKHEHGLELMFEARGANARPGSLNQYEIELCIGFELDAMGSPSWSKVVPCGFTTIPVKQYDRRKDGDRFAFLIKRNLFWTEVDIDPNPGSRSNEPHSVLASAWSRILQYLPAPDDEDRNWSLDPPI
ncbi:hypothetical protein IVB27_09655 [Bradyrhizobium sp. 197]|uniref:hypothetical protein n=1 Tax=Bradyrhizobium sp. 197 TaxID=2782663 RepID=UPI001FF82F93|nr:hypothetical protein [Bradyrhizobium sp. 197]MCK1475058.1 hypothetical protein [Bradyrhizobium sp. 197]